jgi:hypothetical protein
MLELTEVRELLDAKLGGKNVVDEETLQTAIQALLHHQCFYEDTPALREAFRVIVQNPRFFERYFAAIGVALVIDTRTRMVALDAGATVFGWKQNRLRKDETLVLLTLRWMLEEGLREGAIDGDLRVETTTNELYDRIKILTGSEPPDEARLIDIMKDLRRRGAVRLGDRDRVERVTPLTIMPGIRILVPDAYVDAISAWLSRPAASAGDLIDHTASYFATHQTLVANAAVSDDVQQQDSEDLDAVA